MSTICRFRNPSPIQYLKVANDLTSHTSFYLDRMPKSTKFTRQIKLNNLVQDTFLILNKANVLRNFKTIEEYERRKGYFKSALENLFAFECFLSVLAQNDNYYKLISQGSSYAWEHWGELLDTERKLIYGILEKDKEKKSTLGLDI